MAGPQAQRPISQYQHNEGTSASRVLQRQTMAEEQQHAELRHLQQHLQHQQLQHFQQQLTYGMHQQQHRQQLEHVEISVDDGDDETTQTKNGNVDVENGVGGSGGGEKRVRHRHHHRRPLYRRLISYVRSAWTAGVNFSSSNGTFSHNINTIVNLLKSDQL